MQPLTSITPEEAGLSTQRLSLAYELLQETSESGFIPSAVLVVGRDGRFLPPRAFGHAGSAPDAPFTKADSIFLIASITKPMTATAVAMLVEDGRLTGLPAPAYRRGIRT